MSQREETPSPLWDLPSSDTEDEVSAAQTVEHMTCHPYTQAQLVYRGKQFWQRVREPLAAWLLCLWDSGMDSITCTDNDMEKLASITTHPPLPQQLQIAGEMQGGRDLIIG